MGTITISMKNMEEEKLRKLAFKKFGKKKGALSRVIIEAIKKFENEEIDLDKRLIEIAKKGLHLGKVNIKKMREDMYGRHKGI